LKKRQREKMDSNHNLTKQVVIIGAGIAGLATAYTLQERARAEGLSIRYMLLESSAKLGGKIVTDQPEGCVIEGGPDSFLAQKPWAAQLAQALGLEQDLIGTNQEQKKLFVVNRGRLTPMPDGVMLIIPTRFMPFITTTLISWPGKIRMGMDFFIPRRKDDSDESIGNFIRRRLGKEALEKIAEPLMSGIHVSDPEQQSLLGTFPRFRALENQHGSLIRGMLAQQRAARSNRKVVPTSDKSSWKSSVFVSLRGGMKQLVQALEKSLEQNQIQTGCTVTKILPLPEGGYRISTAKGETLRADAVVLATPAFISSSLVSGFSTELASALKTIRYVSTATVSLAFRKSDVGNPLHGVGFIIPRRENRRISACTISSTKFSYRAPQDQILLRCFLGGPGHEEVVEHSDAQIIADARAELETLLGIHAEPILARVYRWVKGNAQYDVGHLERVKEIHTMCAETPGLFLTGSAYEGIGVPDCIHQGQQAAEKVLEYLQEQEQHSLFAVSTGQ
jgi:protoporphyrinogen/coproporphyrinogen III oxidase